MTKLSTFTASILIIFFCSNISLGQTTQAEYNYITKGYQSQVIEQGGDMKKGYALENVDELEGAAGEIKITLKKLNKIGETKKELAAYMLIYDRKGVPTVYLCIPTPNSDKEILNTAWQALYDDGTIDQNYRLWLITLLLSKNLR